MHLANDHRLPGHQGTHHIWYFPAFDSALLGWISDSWTYSLTLTDVAEQVDSTRDLINRYALAGKIPGKKIRYEWRFKAADLSQIQQIMRADDVDEGMTDAKTLAKMLGVKLELVTDYARKQKVPAVKLNHQWYFSSKAVRQAGKLMVPDEEPDDKLTMEAGMQRTGLSYAQIVQALRSGILPGEMINGKWFISPQDLDR